MLNIKEYLISGLKSFKHYLSAIILIITALFFLSIAVIAVWVAIPGPLTNKTTLLIKPGYTTKKIATLLEKSQVISNKWIFIVYTKLLKRKTPLKAGEYEFASRINIIKIVKQLASGESIVRKITIPEGFTVAQIIKMLNDEPRLAGQINNIPAEGSLFPSTYYFKYGDLRSKIIRMMEDKMQEVVIELMPKLSSNSAIKDVNQLLTFASIVEKEAGNDFEKPVIASVFFNRLRKNMKLQADPTVIYAITNGSMILDRPLTKTDLKLNSPYNTYVVLGLPPAPIACPGRKSLNATIFPATTNYLFFVVNGKGGHNFSVTLDTHNGYVKQLREREQAIKLEQPSLTISPAINTLIGESIKTQPQ